MPRCAKCPGAHKCIAPDGKRTPGGLLFVAEAPGHTEEKVNRPMVGKTGEEVDRHYLPLAGLQRRDITIHNAISCFPVSVGGKLDPDNAKDLELLDSCAAENLYPLIEEMQPKLIIPMGNFACRAVYGEAFDLELKHGLPTESPWGPTFPMYHPALGLHTPKQMLYIRSDWDRLRRYLRGTLITPVDAYAGFEDYAEVTDLRELDDLDPTIPLGGDTESSKQLGPFCLTYSQYPGTGRLIRAERHDLIAGFQRRIEQWESDILFHNWLYDWSEVEEMGIRFPIQRVVDTMQVVYHLGNLPQGLKALALRELGMEMQAFEDLVKPHSTRRVMEYLTTAAEHPWPKPEAQMVIGENGKWKKYQPQGLSTKFKRFFTDYKKNPNLDVFRRWDNWESSHEAIESVMGPWPGMDIRHAPFEEVIFYACRDADTLIRLWPMLRRMQRLTRRYAQERWREKAA